MINIKLNQLTERIQTLTQVNRVSYEEGHLPVGPQAKPAIFTRTWMASVSGDYLFEVGAGALDSVSHTRLLMQYSADVGKPLAEVVDDYLSLLSSVGYSQETFRRVVAGVMGAFDRPSSQKTISAVTPTYLYKLLTPCVAPGTADILIHMMTDFLCHMLAPLGWILRDAPYVYRMRRTGYFPRFSDLVDTQIASEVQRSIQALADSDLSLVKQAMDRKASLLPAMVAQHLSNAVVTAHEMSLGTYDATSVVVSVLSAVGYDWDIECPEPLQLKERVKNHPVMAELRSNAAVFLAYQDMIAEGVEREVFYSDEEMASVILPSFAKSMAELSPFKTRIIDDVVAHIGKRSTRNNLGVPGNIIVYEDWDFSADVSAFSRNRQTATGNQCFLRPQVAVTSALSGAMKPIRSAMGMKSLVERRITTFEMSAASNRVPTSGTEMTLAFPSLTETELAYGIETGALQASFAQDDPLKETEQPGALFTAKVQSQIAFDYYALVMHLAIVKTASVSIGHFAQHDGRVPYIIWDLATDLKEPIAASAIVTGRVVTAEPLEVLGYVSDFQPLEPRVSRALPIDDFRSAVHLWDWHGASIPLELNPAFPITIRNKSYLAAVTEHEMLGLGARRTNVRFIRPLMASAMVRVWMTWLMEDNTFIDGQIAATKDTLIKESFKGRAIRNAMEMVVMLTSIGSTGAGANASRRITRRLADQMYKAGNIDDHTEIHYGVQRHRLNIWAGLAVLQLLGLTTIKDATAIISYLEKNDALAMIVGTVEMDRI